MLQKLRSKMSSLLISIFVILLLAAFVLSGATGLLTGLTNQGVADIGEAEITQQDFARQFQNSFTRYQQQFGGELTRQTALALGLDKQVLEEMVNQAALTEAARQLGIRVSDQELRDYIFSVPGFKNTLGEFDKFQFEQVARYQGYSTSELEELLRDDLVRQRYVTAIAGNITIPKVVEDTYFKFLKEQRNAEILNIKATDFLNIAEPTAEELDAYYTENSDQYQAPEYRNLSYVTVAPQDFAPAMEVSDAELQSEYDSRLNEFSTEDQRQVKQMAFDDESSAQAAIAELLAGKDFLEVTKNLTGVEAADADIGLVTKADTAELHGDDAADIIFTTAPGQNTDAIETDFGWYIFRVDGIKAGSAKALDEVKGQLLADLKARKAENEIYRVTNTIEDELASGATLEEVAEVTGLSIKNVAETDINGRASSGNGAANVPAIDGFLAKAFEAFPGDEVELIEDGADGFYMVRVENITDAALRPFAEVETAIRTNWNREQQIAKARETADKIRNDVEAGQTLDELTAQLNAESSNTTLAVTKASLVRTTPSTEIAPVLQQKIFEQKVGDVVVENAVDNNGFVIIHITGNSFPDATATDEERTAVSQQLKNVYQSEVISLYRTHLNEALPIIVRDNVAKAVVNQLSSNDAQ